MKECLFSDIPELESEIGQSDGQKIGCQRVPAQNHDLKQLLGCFRIAKCFYCENSIVNFMF